VICLATLGYYKYTAFFLTTILNLWAHVARPPQMRIPEPLLPLGVSFFVFHAISLMMDAYRGKLKERVRLGDALLYVAFLSAAHRRADSARFEVSAAIARRAIPMGIRVNRALLLIVGGTVQERW
jgi:alginate O-acetyltransferase complex protein AlgI